MSVYTGHSVTIKNYAGSTSVDLADYGVCVLDGIDCPIYPAPHSETVNIPGKVGGYTYQNYADARTLILPCVCTGGSLVQLQLNLATIAAYATVSTAVRIYPDAWSGYYWIGRRISEISGQPKGGKSLFFDLEFMCDDPRPRNAETDEVIG